MTTLHLPLSLSTLSLTDTYLVCGGGPYALTGGGETGQVAYGWLSRQGAQAGMGDEAPHLGRVGLAVLLQNFQMEPPAHKAGT